MFSRKEKQTGTVSGSWPRSGLWTSSVGDRSIPASSAMEKEKVRNSGPRKQGQPGVLERRAGGSEVPTGSPPSLYVSSTLPNGAVSPAGPAGDVQRWPRKRAASTPAHLPATPVPLNKKGWGRSYVR